MYLRVIPPPLHHIFNQYHHFLPPPLHLSAASNNEQAKFERQVMRENAQTEKVRQTDGYTGFRYPCSWLFNSHVRLLVTLLVPIATAHNAHKTARPTLHLPPFVSSLTRYQPRPVRLDTRPCCRGILSSLGWMPAGGFLLLLTLFSILFSPNPILS